MSNVSSEVTGAHGVPEVSVNDMDATISPRVPVIPAFENGRLVEKTSPPAMVKLDAVPIAVPLEFAKLTVPVQDAAVPVDDAVAAFRMLICNVSVLPIPTGGKAELRVDVVLVMVCANAASGNRADRDHFLCFS